MAVDVVQTPDFNIDSPRKYSISPVQYQATSSINKKKLRFMVRKKNTVTFDFNKKRLSLQTHHMTRCKMALTPSDSTL